MNLHKLLLTKNECYIVGKIRPVRGIMVHSTGANNPKLSRYVGPNDGLLGENLYGNHWNTARPGGRQVCVHAFIGKLADGSIATYQTLPWEMRGWHCGSGSKGTCNDTHIGFEICEDAQTDKAYFQATYREAVELCAYLCKLYNLNPLADGVVISHAEGHQRGLASNHGDTALWWDRYNVTMNQFRADVKAEMTKEEIDMTKEELEALTDQRVESKVAAKLAALTDITGTGDNPSSWAKEAAEWAKAQGLFDGDGKGNYGWQKPVTREQLAVILKALEKAVS